MSYDKFGLRWYIGCLPGWDWLRENEHKYDNWQPTLEITRPGFRTTITTKNTKALNEAIKEITK